MDALTETRQKLPSGFIEVKQTSHVSNLSRDEIPWLAQPEAVGLVRIRLNSGTEFYFGNLIRGKSLADAVKRAEDTRKKNSIANDYTVLNKLLYCKLPPFIEDGYSTDVYQVINPRTRNPNGSKRPIYYVKNNPGPERVYFIKGDDTEGKMTVIRIAACIKSDQKDKVLKVIAHD